MRFSSNLNVDVTKWKCARLEKERTVQSEKSNVEEAPKFGFGSEFGKEAKEEARRKKFGHYMKKSNEDPPWILKVGGKSGRKYVNSKKKTTKSSVDLTKLFFYLDLKEQEKEVLLRTHLITSFFKLMMVLLKPFQFQIGTTLLQYQDIRR